MNHDILWYLSRLNCDLKKVSSREWHGPCPSCRGTDRLMVWPDEKQPKCLGAYRCRICDIYGDTIKLIMDFFGKTYKEAMEELGITITNQEHHQIPRRPAGSPLALPAQNWRENAAALVEWSHQQIFSYPEVVAFLARRGITLECIRMFKIGYNPKDLYFERVAWGLENELNDKGKPRKVWIPKGIIIPTIDTNGRVLRIKIRRDDWHEGDGNKYVNVSGNTKIFSGYGDRNKEVMILVESELDAITVAYYAGEFAFAAAAGSNISNPDPLTQLFADQARYILICHDNDGAGRKMRDKWVAMYPKAFVCPTPKKLGKDVGEACANGLDIKEWLYNFLINVGCKVSRLSSAQDNNKPVIQNELAAAAHIIKNEESVAQAPIQTKAIAASEASESLHEVAPTYKEEPSSDWSFNWDTIEDHLDLLYYCAGNKGPRPGKTKRQ